MMTRRQFLTRTAGTVAAAGTLTSMTRELHAISAWSNPLGLPIGGQVYPHRQRIQDGDFAGLLRDMKALGIDSVELDSPDYAFAATLADGKATRRILDDHGLKCPSIHFTMRELRTRLQESIAWAKDIGAEHVSTASLNGKSTNGSTTLDEVKRAADEFNQIAAVVAKAGLLTTLHDETFEMSKVEDGRVTYHVLFDLLDPKTVFMQFQMSSMRVVGDPVMLFTKYPGRFRSMHLQGVDLSAPAPTPPSVAGAGQAGGGRGAPQVAVGHDSLDWRKIFLAAKTGGITNYFVEQSWDLMVQSVAYLKTLQV
jgi:sugar phosphate isomerase/epimerase